MKNISFKTLKLPTIVGLFVVAMGIGISSTLKISESKNPLSLAFLMRNANAQGELSERTVKNYDLTIWMIGNDSNKLDAKDCTYKDCALYSENGTCTFTY